MRFYDDVTYSPLEDFWLDHDEAINAGYKVEENYVIIPAGTEFKITEISGPSGNWPEIELIGINDDPIVFASTINEIYDLTQPKEKRTYIYC